MYKVIRRRLFIRRFYSERYILIVLLAFSFSISFTRLFLEISDYPQLLVGEYHFAHALWGGLALFVSSLLPLIFSNRRAFDISALISGIGMGLFIDEVGKLITHSNDYFHPAAAPIVYSFFLIILLTLASVRNINRQKNKASLFHLIELFEEILEDDLSNLEFQRIENLFKQIDLEKLSDIERKTRDSLYQILENEKANLVPHQPDILERIWNSWLKLEQKIMQKDQINSWLLILWVVLGVGSFVHAILTFYIARSDLYLVGIINELFQSTFLVQGRILWAGWIPFIGEITLGCVLISTMFFVWKEKYLKALSMAFFALVFQIVFVNLFVFYFEQFSAIVFTILQAAALFATSRYRKAFIDNQKR